MIVVSTLYITIYLFWLYVDMIKNQMEIDIY